MWQNYLNIVTWISLHLTFSSALPTHVSLVQQIGKWSFHQIQAKHEIWEFFLFDIQFILRNSNFKEHQLKNHDWNASSFPIPITVFNKFYEILFWLERGCSIEENVESSKFQMRLEKKEEKHLQTRKDWTWMSAWHKQCKPLC